jgi:hypothetical protein
LTSKNSNHLANRRRYQRVVGVLKDLLAVIPKNENVQAALAQMKWFSRSHKKIRFIACILVTKSI